LDPVDNTTPKGPISRRDLDVMIRTNTLMPDNYVFKAGMANWTAIEDVRELTKEIMGKLH
jgi:hypothetical protein